MGKLKSFTLIETIIVIGITSLIVPVVFSIVFVILQQQTKIIRLQEVKRQGDFVLTNIKTTIRNSAMQIYNNSTFGTEWCSSALNPHSSNGGTDFYFKDKLGRWFNYYLADDKISSGSSLFVGDPKELTNTKVVVSSFVISCIRQTIYAPPIISLTLVLRYNYDITSSRPEDIAELTYQTNIKLKSY